MRTAATQGDSVVPGPLSGTAPAWAPSSMTRADAPGASRAPESPRADMSRANRFIIGVTNTGQAAVLRDLFVAIRDAAPVQIVGRELDLDPVAGQDADVVTSHLPRDVAEDLVPVVELDLEHGVREGFNDLALHLDLLFLGHSRQAPQMARTFTAFGPLSPVSSSYSTLEFSVS